MISCNEQKSASSDFVPKGYVVFEKYLGDSKKEGKDDCGLMIKNTNQKNVVINRFDKKVDRNRRGLIILLKKGNNYHLADKNYDFFHPKTKMVTFIMPLNFGLILIEVI